MAESDLKKETERANTQNYLLAQQLATPMTAVLNLAKFVSEPLVPEEVRARRESICQKCTAADQNGEKLFRHFKGNVYTCGVIFLKKPFRVPAKDGCGCVLNTKWLGSGQSCPIGSWTVVEKEVPKTRRCCGR